MAITGGCLCGGTRYELLEEPKELGDCHCVDCRRSSGAPFVTWGTVSRGAWRLTTGSLRRIPFAGRIRGFAPCCGTQLLFEERPDSDTVDVTIASLDNPAPFPPAKAIWTEDKLPWVSLDAGLPVFRRSARG